MPSLDLSALADPYPVEPLTAPPDAVVVVPGSKSMTNRALVCAALAEGTSVLEGVLFADDTRAMLGVLRAVGIDLRVDEIAARVEVVGGAGSLPATEATVDVGQSGTTARFATPLLALGRGRYHITGHPQLLARPMGPTFDALRSLGVAIEELGSAERLPATVGGASLSSGVIHLPGDVSSQFLSGLLLAGPRLPDGLVVELTTPLVSRPYVELTIAVMAAFGIDVVTPDDDTFAVPAGHYRATTLGIEPDATAASYFWAAAAITGGTVRVAGLTADAVQGDIAFAAVLEDMGARVDRRPDGIEVRGSGELRGGEVDLRHLSDTAQTLAAVAAFADGPTRVTGIGFIRGKETDRIGAVVKELRRCGLEADEEDDGFVVHPGSPQPAVVQTYEDHRMAMSFALLGLRVPGIQIADPGCVAKTFPGYWDVLDTLRRPAPDRAVPNE